MIIFLIGENTYQSEEEIRRIATAGSRVERLDVDTLDEASLATAMKGSSLFVDNVCTVISELSSKSDLWLRASEWIPQVDDDTTIIFREPKPDKRTKAYKTFTANATVIEVVSWTERQRGLAESWLREAAKDMKVPLAVSSAREMVNRALIAGARSGQRVIDQSLLMRALESFVGSERVTDDMIDAVLPRSTSDAIFDIIEIAVDGDMKEIQERIADLKVSQDGYQLFSLIVSQWSQLVMVSLSKGEGSYGIHPFVHQKLVSLTRRVTRTQLRDMTDLAASLDIALKTTALSPWDATTRLLLGISGRV